MACSRSCLALSRLRLIVGRADRAAAPPLRTLRTLRTLRKRVHNTQTDSFSRFDLINRLESSFDTHTLHSFISETVAGNIAGSPAPRLAKKDRTGIYPIDLLKQHHKALKLAAYGQSPAQRLVYIPSCRSTAALLDRVVSGLLGARLFIGPEAVVWGTPERARAPSTRSAPTAELS